jgi:hypothetical protein
MEGTSYPVYVYSEHSKVHFAMEHDGHMLSNEKCNLDDLDKDSRIVVLEVPRFDSDRFCLTCFPGWKDKLPHG